MKFFGHLSTITKHRHQVIIHCAKAGILWQGLFHDLSKYSPTEFFRGVKNYTDGVKSPNEKERQSTGYSIAWIHHKGRNRHHFEYWNDYNPQTKRVMGVKMPINYVKEMFCDRVAASKIYQKDSYNQKHPLEYFLRGKENRTLINSETSDLLEKWLTILYEKGEKEAFRVIRNTDQY